MDHRFTRLFLGNWMSFAAASFQMGNMKTFLNGHNGSGKTTVMDALTMILYAESPDMLNYTGDQKRNDKGAIHWNTPNGYLRPGRTTSYIIIEARDANGRFYHQGIKMVSSDPANDKARVSRTYFQGEGTLEEIGAADGAYDQVKNGTITMKSTFNRREDAFCAFFARRGFPVDGFIKVRFKNLSSVSHFRNMNRSILSNTGISGKSLSDYAKNNIFPSASTTEHISGMVESQKQLDQLTMLAKALEKKSAFLGRAVERGAEYLDRKRTSSSFERAAANINYDFYQSEIARLQDEEMEAERLHTEKIKEIEEAGRRVKELTAKKTRIEDEDAPDKKYEAQRERAKLLLAGAKERQKGHESFLQAMAALMDILPEGAEPESSGAVRQRLEKEKEDIHEKLLKDRASANEAMAKITALKAVIEGDLSKGTGNYKFAEMMQSASLLKERIMDAIPEADPKLLYECIEMVSDPEWQDAVERLLGNDRLGVVVSPEYYHKACAVQHGLKGNKRDVVVLNTARAPKWEEDNSVPSILVFNDERAGRYVRSAYGRYVLCDTDGQYAAAQCAIRKNGQTKVPNRSILYGTLSRVTRLLGYDALRRELEGLEADHRILMSALYRSQQEYESIKQETELLSRLILNYETLAFRKDEAAAADVQRIEDEIARLTEQIEDFRNSEEAKARAKAVKKIEDEILTVEEQQRTANSENGDIESRLRGIRKDLGESQNQFDKFRKSKEAYGELLDEDIPVIEANEWGQKLLGEPNVNSLRKKVEADLKAAKTMLDSLLSDNRDIHTSMPGAPMAIEDERALEWFEKEDRKTLELRMDPESTRQMWQIRESLKSRFAEMLHGMYQDFQRAKEVHKKFNSFLPKYKVGICRYRLGEIKVKNAADAYLMELAVKQESGEQLTKEDIQYIDHVFEDVVMNAERGITSNPFDYQRYVTTRMEYRTDDMEKGSWLNADRTSNANSNGQQTILRYILKIVVLASQAFTEKSMRLCITDEVLQGVDDVNAAYFFDALKEMNIQCIFASMDTRFAEHADDSYTFRMEKGKYVRIIRHGIRKDGTGDAA